MSTAYEIDFSVDDNDWFKIPRRCADLAEAKDVASKVLDLYAPQMDQHVSVRFRRVE